MKYDMHCHTSEGSIDAKVKIEDYARELMQRGFSGMLVTDHNSYKGYEHWLKVKDKLSFSHSFTVLKGIEYDTRDGGHFLAILPDAVKSNFLTIRGMTARSLVHTVHELGGILGPAHPFDTGYYAYQNNKVSKKDPELEKEFDFVEIYNSCAKVTSNLKAKFWALGLMKTGISGSDSHRIETVGSAYTRFSEPITCNDDLIKAIKNRSVEGITENMRVSMKRPVGYYVEKAGIVGYWWYNKIAAFRYAYKRSKIKKIVEKIKADIEEKNIQILK